MLVLLCCAVQLSEESLLQLAELGYSHKSASRALRFSGGNLQQAVDFLDAQQEKKQVSAVRLPPMRSLLCGWPPCVFW